MKAIRFDEIGFEQPFVAYEGKFNDGYFVKDKSDPKISIHILFDGLFGGYQAFDRSQWVYPVDVRPQIKAAATKFDDLGRGDIVVCAEGEYEHFRGVVYTGPFKYVKFLDDASTSSGRYYVIGNIKDIPCDA